MARLKSYFTQILGETVEFPIKCSSDGVFSSNIASKYLSIVNDINLDKHKTRESLIQAINKLVEHINTASTTFEDRILFRIAGKNYALDNDTAGLNLTFVAIRTYTTGKKVEHRRIVSHNPTEWMSFLGEAETTGLPEGYRVDTNNYDCYYTYQLDPNNADKIPFSTDAVKFFEAISRNINSLQNKLVKFLEPHNVEMLVSSNQIPESFDAMELNEL